MRRASNGVALLGWKNRVAVLVEVRRPAVAVRFVEPRGDRVRSRANVTVVSDRSDDVLAARALARLG